MANKSPNTPPQTKRFDNFVAALILLVIVFVLQNHSGAYESEYGGDPDEAAHFVTGLMVHDYVKQLASQERIASPLTYAEKYYEHYPKVALGHYPPGFYVFESLWMTIAGTSTGSMMVFMSLQCVLWAILVFILLSRVLEFPWALLASALLVALPVVQDQTARIMADVMLSIFCLGAAWAWIAYMRKPGWLPSIAFGLLATCAIYMKGSGILLAFIPPIAILRTWRLDLLKKPSLWASAVIVAVLCAPWMYITTKISSEGFQEPMSIAFTAKAIKFYIIVTWEIFGSAGTFFLIYGLWHTFSPCKLSERKDMMNEWAVLTALISGFYITHCIIPVGLDARYFLPALPAFLALVAFGLKSSIDALAENFPRPGAVALPCLVMLMSFNLESFELREKRFTGMTDVAENIITADKDHPHAKILISSGPMGEGAFIGAVAEEEQRLGHRILRSSKYVSESDWRGRDYSVQFSDWDALIAALQADNVRWVVVDESLPEKRRLEHHTLIADAMSNTTAYRQMSTFPLDRGNRGGKGMVFLYLLDEIADR